MKFSIDEVWIDEDAADYPLTGRILSRLACSRVLTGMARREAEASLLLDPDPLRQGKKILRLAVNKGVFVKPCPGTPSYVCCGLQILHIGQGCPMDCRYCALQAYLNRPVLEVFVNVGDLLKELELVLSRSQDSFLRFCTGEFTDSLALDPVTRAAAELAEFFSGRTDCSLELKTKTDLIGPLLDIDPRGAVVVSFSLSSQSMARNDELRSASLSRRLDAAAAVQQKGYRLGFHFDPIIPMSGWEQGYFRTADEIFRRVDSSSISWISLGVIRFAQGLKETAEARFGAIPYFHDGFVRGLDGKSRLFVDRRVRIYRAMADRIRRHAQDARIYLCMESPYVWWESLGLSIQSDADLARYLDERRDGNVG
jgi:spore photoproduct lyase